MLFLQRRNLNNINLSILEERFDDAIESSRLFCYDVNTFSKQLTILMLSYCYTDEWYEPIPYVNSFDHIVQVFVHWSDWCIEVSIYPSDYEEWDGPIGWGVVDMEDMEWFEDLSFEDQKKFIKDKVDFMIELSETY